MVGRLKNSGVDPSRILALLCRISYHTSQSLRVGSLIRMRALLWARDFEFEFQARVPRKYDSAAALLPKQTCTELCRKKGLFC